MCEIESFRSVYLIILFAPRTKNTLLNILIKREIQIHNNDILKVQPQRSEGFDSISAVKYA